MRCEFYNTCELRRKLEKNFIKYWCKNKIEECSMRKKYLLTSFPFHFEIEPTEMSKEERLRLAIKQNKMVITNLQNRLSRLKKKIGLMKVRRQQELSNIRKQLRFNQFCRMSYPHSKEKTRSGKPIIMCTLYNDLCKFQCGIIPRD